MDICNKGFAAIHSLKKIQRFLPLHSKLTLVRTLMFSHLTYCSPMNDMAVVLSDKLQGSQNHCFRFVYMTVAIILHQFTLNLKSTNKLTKQISKFFHVLVLKLQTSQPKYFSEIYFFVLGKSKNFSHCFVHATQTSA